MAGQGWSSSFLLLLVMHLLLVAMHLLLVASCYYRRWTNIQTLQTALANCLWEFLLGYSSPLFGTERFWTFAWVMHLGI